MAIATWQDILRRKILYFALVILVLVLAGVYHTARVIGMAQEAGETGNIPAMAMSLVSHVASVFGVYGMIFALFFGSTALSSDTRERLVAGVLARPIHRWEYLLGKWCGVLLFTLSFVATGIALASGIAVAYDVSLPRTFWFGLAGSVVRVFLLSGVAIGFSVFMAPVLAGVASLFVTILPGMVAERLHHPDLLWRFVSYATLYLCPAEMPAELLDLDKSILVPDFRLYLKVMTENVAYVVVVFGLACAAFSHRDAPLKP